MQHCPDPDPVYAVAHGTLPTRERYCEDVVASFVHAIRMNLGTRAPAAVSEMFIETNRVATAPTVVPVARTNGLTSSEQEASTMFSSALQQARDTIRDLSTAQRRTMADALFAKTLSECDCMTLEETVRMVLLRPWNDTAAAFLVRSCHRHGDTLRPQLLKRVRDLYQRNAAADSEWKRGLRGFLFFTGDFERAYALARELATTHDRRYEYRDATMLAILERLRGDRNDYDRVIDACPPPPEMWSGNIRAEDLCRSVAFYTARQYGELQQFRQERTPPVLQEILAETIRSNRISDEERFNAWRSLLPIDDGNHAAPALKALIENRETSAWLRTEAHLPLGRILFQQHKNEEAMAEVGAYLDSGYVDPGFTPKMWETRTAMTPPARMNDDIALKLKAQIAIASHEFPLARRTIEQLVAEGFGRFEYELFPMLFDLANAEIDAGDQAAALRILAYALGRT